ncbi:hypothetical protein SAMN05216554_2713 [Herbiconiux ginsengi]|uniref:Uncharacterized protein n=2 Tax=Herbiconiux ginsengi TaxID=381665 RepID=A0A1H3QT78_9MICO|nr:hypothetical protein SAMN05216554_2713 [Herbiconiux ginsengi]
MHAEEYTRRMSDANGGNRPPFPENVPAAGTGMPQSSHDGAQQPPATAGQPAPASAATPVAARHPKRVYAIGGAILVAVVGATASAVITPERLDGLFAMFGGGAGAGVAASASSTPPGLETKNVSSGDKALSFAIPAEWGARTGNYNVSPDAGTAVVTGTQVDSPVEFGEDGAYVAVSKDFATRTGLAGLESTDLRARADDLVGKADWTIDGCIASDEPSREKDGWQLATRYWTDCAQIPDSKLWEMVAIDDEGTMVVTLQVLLSPDASPEVMDTIVGSFTVDPRKVASGLGGDVVLP